VAAAIQEDVDVVGLSILSGAHLAISQRVIDLLKAQGAADVPVFLGGIIPTQDIAELAKMGIRQVFLPGTTLEQVIKSVREAAQPQQ